MKVALQIPLREDCLVSPTRWDLAVLETAMLWPDNADAREAALKTSTVQCGGIAKRTDATVPAWLFEMAAEATPLAQMQLAAKQPFVHGVIVGTVLHDVLVHASTEEGLSIGHAIERATKPFCHQRVAGFGHRLKLTPHTIENTVWPKYRTVAHLWAAALNRSITRRDDNFPCAAINLAAFLAEAEAYRQLGETVRTFKAPKNTVLRAAEMAWLPSSIEQAIQPVKLVFERPLAAA